MIGRGSWAEPPTIDLYHEAGAPQIATGRRGRWLAGRDRGRLRSRAVNSRERPLPDSLARYLAASPAGRRNVAPWSEVRSAPPTERGSAHHALESALLRGFVYVTSGLVWLLVLGLVVRHVAR